MFKKPRSTQRPKHSYASGHVERSPTANNPHAKGAPPERLASSPSTTNDPPHFGPRNHEHEEKRLSNITSERARSNASPMARRLTKFITNFHGQVRIPHDLLSKDRYAAGDQPEGPRCIEVGQIPED